MDNESYKSTCNELGLLISYGIEITNYLTNKPAPLDRDFYSDRIFSKLLCHAITLKRIIPTGLTPIQQGQTELWDLSSTCALARALIESYDSLFYIAVDDIPDDEREFRLLLWELHAEERREKKLDLIGSKSPRVSEIKEDIGILREKIISHDFFNSISNNTKNKIQKRNSPAFYLTHSERNKLAFIDHDYYTSSIMFLSAHVHTLPFSIQQLIEFKAGDINSLQLMSLPIQYAIGFLAKGIEGMEIVFGSKLPEKDKEVANSCIVWCEILSNGIAKNG